MGLLHSWAVLLLLANTTSSRSSSSLSRGGGDGIGRSSTNGGASSSAPLLADYVVVVAEGAPAGTLVHNSNSFAAAELANLVGNLTDPAWRDIETSSDGRILSQGVVGRPLRTTNNLTSTEKGPRMLVGYEAVVAANKTDPAVGYPGLLNDSAGLGNDGFLLWTGHSAAGPFIAFTGSPTSKRGTLNAVYEYVEMLGIRFIAYDETTYPSGTPLLTAPTFARILEPQPQIRWRGMEDWPSFAQRMFSRRVRFVISGSQSGCPEGQMDSPLCKALHPPIYGNPQNDTWDSYHYGLSGRDSTINSALCPRGPDGVPAPGEGCNDYSGGAAPKFIIRDHPEWLWPHPNATERADPALYQARCNGAGECGQVCWHNASLIQYLIATTTQNLATAHVKGRDTDVYSLTQSDNVDFCQDPEEQAIYKAEGSDIGPMLRAVNAVADAVGPDYPNVLFDTFAYMNTLPVPKITKPRPNVVIRICIASCNFAAEYTDPVNAHLAGNITEWGKIADHISVWDYTTNFEHSTCLPYPDWYSFGPNTKFLAKAGLHGYFAEGSSYAPGSDLAKLKVYLMSKLLWKPSRNMTSVISDFLLGYFGHEGGAQAVKTYMDVMSESMRVGGYCRSDEGQGQTFGGTAPFLSPHALLTSAKAFSYARKQISIPKHMYRLDCAKLATYFTILVRWQEMQAWAVAHNMTWPIEATKQEAYNEFMRAANASANADGAWYFSYDGPSVRPTAKQPGYKALTNGTMNGTMNGTRGSYAWQQVFNHSQNWCGNALHPPGGWAPGQDQCQYTWPNASSHVPCCDSCGDHPRYGLSNICMNYSAGDGVTSALPQFDLVV